MTNSNIIIKDPLYKQILVSPKHKKLIDSKEFQRLRNIKQTSFVDLVYPSANHSRFSHSLGTYHLMKKVLSNNLINPNEKTKENLIIAALLHDIGHGPFSHLWERVFPHFDHEKTTQEILKQKGLNEVADILQKKSPYSQLISSTIDVDKLDYMARDSYFAGVSYGVSEVDFIIQHINIKDKKLVISPSAISSVEDMITQRVNLFKTVYFHKFAAQYDLLFIKIFQRVKDLLKQNHKIFLNKHLKTFFDKTNTTKDLLELNDTIVLYHIYEWKQSKDPILKDLCTKFTQRKKFKAINMQQQKINIEKLKKEISKKYNLNYYFSHICLPLNIIQTPIYVEVEGKLKKLEDISELIKFYKTQKWNVEFLICPKDIKV